MSNLGYGGRLAVVGKETVGAIVCTVDDKKTSLCIATLAVLAPHRRSGIGLVFSSSPS